MFQKMRNREIHTQIHTDRLRHTHKDIHTHREIHIDSHTEIHRGILHTEIHRDMHCIQICTHKDLERYTQTYIYRDLQRYTHRDTHFFSFKEIVHCAFIFIEWCPPVPT